MMELPLPPDPIGKLIIIVRDFLEDHGDLTDSGSLDFSEAVVRGTQKEEGDEPPMVIIGRNTISDFPFGAGSGRMGIADHLFIARCFGRKLVSGEREAARLAGLVRAALHNHAPTVMGNVAIYRIRVLSTGAPLRDPDEDTPFVPVSIGLYAASLEAAS